MIFRKLSLRRCLVTFLLFMIGMFIMRNSIAALEKITEGYGIIDLTMGWSKTEIMNHFSYLGERGREYYRTTFYLIDFIYPFLYALFYSTTLAYLVTQTKVKKYVRFFVYIPVIAILFDLSENLLVISMLTNFSTISGLHVVMFNFSNIGKFICVYLSLFSIVVLVILNLIKRLRSKAIINSNQ